MKLFHFLVFTLGFISLFSVTNCAQQPNIQVKNNSKQLLNTDSISTFGDRNNESNTTIILVRHAEKEAGPDPILKSEGSIRATQLAKTLKNIDLSAIYSTQLNRTILTATPTAESKSMDIRYYDPSNLEAVATEIVSQFPNQQVLIIGHSNTNPDLLNILIGRNDYQMIPDDQYDDLFIVNVKTIGSAEVIHLTYGE